MSTFESCNVILEESNRRMLLAYRDLGSEYWEGRNAFTHRFDNFRNMVERKKTAYAVDHAELEAALAAEIEAADKVALYFGVPWCIQTCSFCDLAYSRSPKTEEKEEYVQLLLQELASARKLGLDKKTVASAYFGGGTPSILDTDLLCRYVDSALDGFDLGGSAVITLEASPATLNPRKLEALRQRVTRISLGVQSTDTELRQREGRILPREKLLERIDQTMDYFDLVNADVLYGMPGQTEESIYLTLCDLVRAEVPSITYYRNELFPNTKSHTQAKSKPWDTVEEFNARKMYFFGKTLLEAAGYVENPLGWFVRKTKETQILPWSKMVAGWGAVVPYFGFGVGAFSTSRNYWMQNTESSEDWASRVREGKSPAYKYYPLTAAESFMVRFMRHIRVFERIEWSFLNQQIGGGHDRFTEFVADSIRQGLLTNDGQFLCLTEAGASLIHWLIDDIAKIITNTPAKAEPRVWDLVAVD